MEVNRKRAKVHMLPTDMQSVALLSKRKDDGLLQAAKGINGVANCNPLWTPQHLYITTDEEIKEGDKILWEGKIYDYQEFMSMKTPVYTDYFKIIATTDPKLLKPQIKQVNWMGSERIVSLPQPSQAFIEDYCKVGGIDEVDVEYEMETQLVNGYKNQPKDVIGFVTEHEATGNYKLKVDSHNTITTHRIVEKMYSIDDIEAYCDKYPNDAELGREIRKLKYKQ